MAYYKDIEIPNTLEGVIEYISTVENTREQLLTLGQNWDLLTILGQMSGSRTDMTQIRSGFKSLTNDLIVNLANESLNKLMLDINSKAQVAVDIVIRNLFERTADIGFLATDDDIRAFLNNPAPSEQDQSRIVSRFEDYVAKYSVYYDILLLNPEGQVLAKLDPNNPVTHSKDELIAESITTKNEFCETYRHSDLQPNRSKSLIYSYRVSDSNQKGSRVLGVLCLCFKFEDEMTGVFNNLKSDADKSVISLLDKDGEVIATSDKYQLPTGAVLRPALNQNFELMDFAGRTYIAKTCETRGYQGFEGLGWYGHVMLPLEQAFKIDTSMTPIEGISQTVLDSVMQDPRLFSESLRKIPDSADSIQADLERTVWNGNVGQSLTNSKQASQSIKILLAEIGKTGSQTKRVFERSIAQLHQTVVSSIMSDVKFLSFLAIDIMDRNLYERANDCRWWALTSVFRDTLSARHVSSEDQAKLSSILTYINDLYTVYTNLFIYDKRGKVLAVSNPQQNDLVGQNLDQDWVKKTLSIRDPQQYAVSEFEKTSLYDDKPTYIYSASISASNNSNDIVGGIGVVFDSEPEFAEMLNDTLPKDNDSDANFAVFIDAHKRIISSTSARFKVGDTIDIGNHLISQSNGESCAKVIEHKNAYYALGVSTSAGYREYKSDSDDYSNDVTALVFMLLGEKQENQRPSIKQDGEFMSLTGKGHQEGQESVELATFYVDENWLALDCKYVVEAIGVDKLSKKNGHDSMMVGTTRYKDTMVPVVNLRHALDNSVSEQALSSSHQIVIVKTLKGFMGLLVDALGDIPEFSKDKFTSMNSVIASQSQFIDSIVKPGAHSSGTSVNHPSMLIVLEPNKLLNLILEGESSLISELFTDIATREH